MTSTAHLQVISQIDAPEASTTSQDARTMTSSIAEMNAEAIAKAQDGENTDAASLLCHAFVALQQLCKYGTGGGSHHDHHDQHLVMNGSPTPAPLAMVATENPTEDAARMSFSCGLLRYRRYSPEEQTATSAVTVQLDPTPGRHEELLSVALYNRAFLLVTSDERISNDFVSCILLYNAGLAFHREAIATSRSGGLLRALAMYRQAHAMIEGCSLVAAPTGLITMTMALYHNMSQIHAEFYQIEAVRFFRYRLAQVLDWSGSLAVADHDFSFFTVNLYMGCSEDFRIAPAA